MRRKEFIDTILDSISDKFDIYHNYRFKDKKFVIYAYCYDRHNKYATTDNSKLFDAKSFEHVFFITRDQLDMEEFNKMKNFAISEIEPHFVRGDGKNPVKRHMYSYITFVVITRDSSDNAVEEAVKNMEWTKNYMLSAKGYSSIRMAVVTPREYKVVSSKNATDIKDYLSNIMFHIDHFEDD